MPLSWSSLTIASASTSPTNWSRNSFRTSSAAWKEKSHDTQTCQHLTLTVGPPSTHFEQVTDVYQHRATVQWSALYTPHTAVYCGWGHCSIHTAVTSGSHMSYTLTWGEGCGWWDWWPLRWRGQQLCLSTLFLGAAAGSPYIVFKLTFSYGFMFRIYIYIYICLLYTSGRTRPP